MIGLFIFFIVAVLIIVVAINEQKIRHPKDKEDDIETLDGGTFLIKDDNAYVIYKLESAFVSKYVKDWKFNKISDTEGEIIFGDVNFQTLGRGGNDYGHTYNITIEPQGDNTLMHLRYVGKTTIGTMGPSKLLSQAYYYFFKEQFEVLQFIPARQG